MTRRKIKHPLIGYRAVHYGPEIHDTIEGAQEVIVKTYMSWDLMIYYPEDLAVMWPAVKEIITRRGHSYTLAIKPVYRVKAVTTRVT